MCSHKSTQDYGIYKRVKMYLEICGPDVTTRSVGFRDDSRSRRCGKRIGERGEGGRLKLGHGTDSADLDTTTSDHPPYISLFVSLPRTSQWRSNAHGEAVMIA